MGMVKRWESKISCELKRSEGIRGTVEEHSAAVRDGLR